MDKTIIDAATAAGNIKDDSLVGTMYKDFAQPLVKALGSALGTTMEFCTTPLLLMKFGSEAAKLNYTKHMNNYAKKLEDIPEAGRISVDPQIGVPIVDKLCSVTSEDIADLFTTLLSKASSIITKHMAHPAFVQMLSSLSSDEAIIIESIKNSSRIPVISVKPMSAYNIYSPALLDAGTLLNKDKNLKYPENIPMYLINLQSLGIIGSVLEINDKSYQENSDLRSYYKEHDAIKSALNPREDIEYHAYNVSKLGLEFLKACTIRN